MPWQQTTAEMTRTNFALNSLQDVFDSMGMGTPTVPVFNPPQSTAPVFNISIQNNYQMLGSPAQPVQSQLPLLTDGFDVPAPFNPLDPTVERKGYELSALMERRSGCLLTTPSAHRIATASLALCVGRSLPTLTWPCTSEARGMSTTSSSRHRLEEGRAGAFLPAAHRGRIVWGLGIPLSQVCLRTLLSSWTNTVGSGHGLSSECH